MTIKYRNIHLKILTNSIFFSLIPSYFNCMENCTKKISGEETFSFAEKMTLHNFDQRYEQAPAQVERLQRQKVILQQQLALAAQNQQQLLDQAAQNQQQLLSREQQYSQLQCQQNVKKCEYDFLQSENKQTRDQIIAKTQEISDTRKYSQKLKKQLKGQEESHEKYKKGLPFQSLPYIFGIVIAEGIHPLLSWINKQYENSTIDTKTIQGDVKKLQLLFLCAAACGGKVHKYFNGSIQMHDSINAFSHGILSVTVQAVSAMLLKNRVDLFEKLEKNMQAPGVKTEAIKTLGRLFIQWSLWRIERWGLCRALTMIFG